jgi:hypothetical protein
MFPCRPLVLYSKISLIENLGILYMLGRSLQPRVREIAQENPKLIILFNNGIVHNKL